MFLSVREMRFYFEYLLLVVDDVERKYIKRAVG